MKKFLIFLIDLYKKYISPIIHDMGFDCKFYPTCSQYTRQAVEKYGGLEDSAV